jgi:predicted DsbA family dithiol-disulfide isomerase
VSVFACCPLPTPRWQLRYEHLHQAFSAAIFRAYLALGKDIGDWSVIAGCADEAGIDSFVFKHEMTSGVADNELRFAEAQAAEHHISGTPNGSSTTASSSGCGPARSSSRSAAP